MLINAGVLSFTVLAAGWIFSVALVWWGLRKFTIRLLPQTAILALIFFLVSLTRLSVGHWSVHFTLLGLMGLTMGRRAFPVIFVCLALQSLFFPFGGFAVVGVNALNMGLPALAVGLLLNRPASRKGRVGDTASFLAGFLATGAVAFLFHASLALSGAYVDTRLSTLIGVAFLFAVLEGLITIFAMRLLRRFAPGLVADTSGTPQPKSPTD